MYFSVSSFCSVLCVYFYMLGRSLTFPNLGEVILYRRPPMWPSSTVPSVQLYAPGVPYKGVVCALLLWGGGHDYCGHVGGWEPALPGWLMWWLQFCSYIGPGPCQAFCISTSVLVLTLGQVPSANRLEGRFQNSTCQCQCYRSRISSPKWLTPASPSPREVPIASCLSVWLSNISRWAWRRPLCAGSQSMWDFCTRP